ncbi:putative MFS family arabinose efflux permease [Sphingobium sp. B11D3B]|uniref:spinster family MFS transporter n=1 Tax=Sphingobium sp. B11D3B TaxID=2940575 RepID=UPI0022279FB6|nr:MFS transporter [Sphingobium sp. B11D3B]MCW2389632.1 putative MFS family arabinose efflux permease [Sphingobium sp. B11D3B]
MSDLRSADNAATPPGWTARTAYTVALLTLIYAFNTVDRNLFGLLVPLIKQDLHLSDTVIGLLSGFAFALFYATAALPIASFADRSNRRNIIAVGLAFWSVMTVLHGFVQNIWQMGISRFLLGAGEATSVAPSNSIIADLFTAEQRPLALGFLSMATSLGILVAFPVLGWVSQDYGWRYAFIAAGLPGILLAILFFFTVREPARIADLGEQKVAEPVNLRQALAYLLHSRGFVLGIAAGTLVSMNMAITHTWVPTFLSRVHHLNQGEIGTFMGFLRGPGGIVGGLAGGWLTMVLGKRDRRWLYGVPTLGMLLIAPAQLLLLFGGPTMWKLGLALETMLVISTIGPLFALLLATAQPRMRSVAIAFFLFVSNMIGQGLGPLISGGLSDILTPALGDEAIRFAMLSAALAALIASLCCWGAGRQIDVNQIRSGGHH